MALNIHVDNAIFELQANGGISRLWRSLLPELRTALPDATWDMGKAADLFISTYYRRAPYGVKSLVIAYDFIAERCAQIGAHTPDATAKRIAIADAVSIVGISQWVSDDVRRFCNRDAVTAYCGGSEALTRALPSVVQAFRQRLNLDTPYVLTVGRRDLYKNVQALYQAWGLWSGAPYHRILLVGGEASLPCERQFEREYPGVILRVTLSDADLATAYTGATALVYPSLYEGFGLPVIEALSCGCTVVTGSDGSLSEVGGDAVLTADVLKPRSLAAALETALDPSIYVERVSRGYALARQFTWSRMAQVVADEIRRIM